eukprot:gene4149-4701_t
MLSSSSSSPRGDFIKANSIALAVVLHYFGCCTEADADALSLSWCPRRLYRPPRELAFSICLARLIVELSMRLVEEIGLLSLLLLETLVLAIVFGVGTTELESLDWASNVDASLNNSATRLMFS